VGLASPEYQNFAIHRTVHSTFSFCALHRPTPSALGRPFFFPSLVDCLRQCIEPFTRAVKFRAFFELLKSVFGIGTSFGCAIPRGALGGDTSSNPVRA
jgi:hypothetical protein